MQVELETRKCCGCHRDFRVLKSSHQEWCSNSCKTLTVGADPKSKAMRVPTVAESNFIATGKRPKSVGDGARSTKRDTPVILNLEKPKVSVGKKDIKKMRPIAQDIIVKESSEPKIIESTQELSKESGMPETKSENEQKSLKTVNAEILGVDSMRQSISLNEETSASLSSLTSVQNELLGLMKSLNPKADDRGLDLLDQDRVRVAAECGKQIISAMRMKLDMLKFVKEIQDSNSK